MSGEELFLILQEAKAGFMCEFKYKYGLCEACKSKPINQIHHKCHNTKLHQKMFGKLIHHPKNIQFVCADCNTGHAGLGLIHWTPEKLAYELGIKIESKIFKRN